MKRFLSFILLLLSFIVQVAVFAFALLPVVYWLSGYAAFLEFIYGNEYVLYAVSGAIALLLVLTGALIRIKRGKLIFAILVGGGLFTGLAFLGLSTLTPLANVPESFVTLEFCRGLWNFLEVDFNLYIAAGVLLLIAFVLSALGRRLHSKSSALPVKKEAKATNVISSSLANDKRFEPPIRATDITSAQTEPPQEYPEEDNTGFFEPIRVIPQPEPVIPDRPRTPQPQRQVFVRDEQGNLVPESDNLSS